MSASPAREGASFRSFELAAWERAAHPYADHWSSLTSQAVDPLLEAAAAGRGARVLDVATGPGWAAAAAAERGASPIGLDFSVAMVRLAARNHSAIRFIVGDAEDLPFADGSFDAVVMNFGLLHLGRPDQAMQEAHRVLRSGGRTAFTVWSQPEEAVAFGMILRAIQARGDANVPLPEGPPFFHFSHAEESRRLLLRAGFTSPTIARVPQVWRLPSPDAVFEAYYKGTARTGGLLRRQTSGALAAIRAAVRDELRGYDRGAGVEVPMPAMLAWGVRPG